MIGIALILSALPMHEPPTRSVRCSYFNKAGGFHEGNCLLSTQPGNGTYSEILDTGETRLVIVQRQRQGQWAKVTINGRLGTRYELNRTNYAITTDDLEISIAYDYPE